MVIEFTKSYYKYDVKKLPWELRKQFGTPTNRLWKLWIRWKKVHDKRWKGHIAQWRGPAPNWAEIVYCEPKPIKLVGIDSP